MSAGLLTPVIGLSGTATRREALVWVLCSLSIGLAVAHTGETLSARWLYGAWAVASCGATAALVRRLHETGRSGWWVLVTLLPLAGLIFMVWIVATRPKDSAPGRFAPRAAYRTGQVALIVVGLLLASRIFWTPHWIPSGSMKPTLLVGDYVITTRLPGSKARRGDVITFLHPRRHEIWIKRVIGLPSDEISLQGGVLTLNGAPVPQTPDGTFAEPNQSQGSLGLWPRCTTRDQGRCEKPRQVETLPGGPSYRILDIGPSPRDDMPPVQVPPGHLFVLGDNRDNALDSRVAAEIGGIGMVPIPNVKARASWVLFSSAGQYLWQVPTWRANRLLKRIP